ncbi:hypothetical protein TRIUR3_00234 [Triticum urartu]|uniref:HMA domain-containing protein n=1 Tax=Triticum urartu TaxID=4572 RepID=M7ZUD9_TRIUA|nr:hypothetical protein TRIUR3_00234 [Triticum urartu]
MGVPDLLRSRHALQMATIIMRVDLDCDRCYKKIRKVLCKLQDRENIKMISYDEKSNTVTVSGSFDAEEVADRLCSDAGKVAPKQHGKEGHGHGPGPPAHGVPLPSYIKDQGEEAGRPLWRAKEESSS